MTPLERRRLMISVGGGALVLLIAWTAAILMKARDHTPVQPPPASTGGLVVQMAHPDDSKVDPAKTLRCFVGGQFEGVETLAACAKKNGVATQALDVGIDQTGALAAAGGQTSTALTPLPPPATAEVPSEPVQEMTPGATAQAPAPHGPAGDCLRYAGSGWRKVGGVQSLSACVQALFAGRCESPGEAAYGRWMDQTLRLVPHRVEISSDNRSFRTVVEQADDSCIIPQF
jgi:hypothetical protein